MNTPPAAPLLDRSGIFSTQFHRRPPATRTTTHDVWGPAAHAAGKAHKDLQCPAGDLLDGPDGALGQHDVRVMGEERDGRRGLRDLLACAAPARTSTASATCGGSS